LTGLNKVETANIYGEEEVQIWKHSFDNPQPQFENSSKFYKIINEDSRYKGGPRKEEFPKFESLKLTIERTLPYSNKVIFLQIKVRKVNPYYFQRKQPRDIINHLDQMSDDAIKGISLQTFCL
jgi:2,3-bisphosphoglycerate-dependent phosphoglycerate mutase